MKWPRSWRQRGIFIQGWCFSILIIRWYGFASNHDIQGSPQISSRDIGYVLRILGQNPTEDEIVEMVMKVKFLDGPATLRPTLDIGQSSCFLRLPPLSLILLPIASTVPKMSTMSTMMTMTMTMTMVMSRQTVSGTGWWQEATFLPLASTFSSKRRMQTTKYKMWSAKCKMPNIKYKMQYAKYRIQFKEEAKIQNANDDDHDNC